MKKEELVLRENQQDRLGALEKIKEYEKLGGDSFFKDIENDPPSTTLLPSDVDYLKSKLSSKIKGCIANIMAKWYQKEAIKNHDIEVRGGEHLNNIPTGAIVISNHFSPFENMAVKTAVDKAKPRHKFYAVIREGNYFMPGAIGYGLKHFRTLPLSSNLQTMKNFDRAVSALLKKKSFILIYPEQAMWWNYRKPRRFKTGAFYYAVKNNVPIVPMFVTMESTDIMDNAGFAKQKYIVHVFPPIYKDLNLTTVENRKQMMEKAYTLWVDKYEEFYNMPLKYDGSNIIQPIKYFD